MIQNACGQNPYKLSVFWRVFHGPPTVNLSAAQPFGLNERFPTPLGRSLLLALGMLSERAMKERILIVDDEAQIREVLSMYFSRQGYETFTASNTDETLRIVSESKVDVVILDIGLADEDGLKLLEQLKRDFPDLRVIMLTGMGFVDDLLQEATQKGADGYVSKVLPMDELLASVQRILKARGG